MTNKTITFTCDTCGRELTFYKDSFAYDGCHCPICDRLGYKPMIINPVEKGYGKAEVLKTRNLFRKVCEKQSNKHTK